MLVKLGFVNKMNVLLKERTPITKVDSGNA
jgi:hypothetical protein